jgi:hypothetical protein
MKSGFNYPMTFIYILRNVDIKPKGRRYVVYILRTSLNNRLKQSKGYKKFNGTRHELYEKWSMPNFPGPQKKWKYFMNSTWSRIQKTLALYTQTWFVHLGRRPKVFTIFTGEWRVRRHIPAIPRLKLGIYCRHFVARTRKRLFSYPNGSVDSF